MKGGRTGFSRLAGVYRALEFLAFGGDLERARFSYLNRLAGCRDILLLGEGDGRCAARLATLAPHARILCVDSSPGMIARASERIAALGAGERVTFTCADALRFTPQPLGFDGAATLFFLDCFDGRGVEAIVEKMGTALRPGSPWLFTDFTMPPSGFARLRARAWLAVLYRFFRLTTGLTASALPASEEILGRAGWVRTESVDLQHGLLRSAVFKRP
jgi:ubiquinone/menaquinone biosynthesis C-methylase UbiE